MTGIMATNVAARVAIVTGGSRGIGRATALKLAEHGLAVVVGYHGNQAAAEEVVTEIVRSGGQVAVKLSHQIGQVFEIGWLLLGDIRVHRLA